MNKKKRNIIMIILIIAIIGVIFLIEYAKDWGNGELEELKCIAENSKLYVSKTCTVCAQQKQILAEGLEYFTLIDCAENAIDCVGIIRVPTWEIDGERYVGFKDIQELKNLTGC